MNYPWEEGASPSVLLPGPASLIRMNCRMLQRPSHAPPTGQESRHEAYMLCLFLESAAQRLSPTVFRRTRIKTLFRLPWQHKTEGDRWQQCQNPVGAMAFGIASEAFVILYGSAYKRSV